MSWMQRRRADAGGRVLKVLHDSPGLMGGYEIGKAARLRPARVYPTLARLESVGFVVAEWEADPGDRPARRLYRLRRAGESS